MTQDMTYNDMNILPAAESRQHGRYKLNIPNLGTSRSQGGNNMFPRWERFTRLLLLLTLLVAGVTGAWGQTDYSGVYYIRSTGKNASDAALYYLCPTEGWYFYEATNKYSESDNGQPFLTTYQIKTNNYDTSKAVWIIEKHSSEENCYYIKQRSTGRYIVSNGQITGSSNANRVRIHLETVADAAALTALGDMALFEITDDGGHLDIMPHAAAGRNGDNKYLVVNNGNYYQLDAQNSKTDFVNGKYGKGTGGIIGLYTHEDNAKWTLEDIPVPAPTITNEITSNIEISCSEEGTKIYYTLDGTNPTTSSTLYEGAIAYNNNIAFVKAIAVRTVGSNTWVSSVAVLPINYTYHIVNQQNKVALTATVRQAVGTALSGVNSIPADIRSSYIDEEVTFYSFGGTYAVGDAILESTFETADPINATPADNTNIYVRYSTTKLGNKYLHLQGARPMNLKEVATTGYDYYKDNGGSVTKENSSEAQQTNNAYQWYIGSTSISDPYDVLIKNSDKTKYLTLGATPTLTVGASNANTYFITDNTPGPDADNDGTADYEDITLKSLAGGTTLTVRVNEVKIPTSYYLIDKVGKIILGPKESTSSNLAIPSEWESPLVAQYHYWKSGDFIETSEGSGVYRLKTADENGGTAPKEINNITELGENHIYVTYDVDPSFVFDTTDDDTVDGTQAYRLEFTGGVSFYQENGKDAVMTTAQKAVFPYSNGDACLYVYGNEQWNTQLSSGASTRTRWLWYLLSPNSDPYHVYIMSHQGQASSHNYFRTFSLDGGTTFVTGVTTKNTKAVEAGEKPTEYMILKAGDNCKLVTVEGHHVVNSFEQYWKNNPTVQNLISPKVTNSETYADNIMLNADQVADLPNNWHTYEAFANAAPWVGWYSDNTGTGKQYLKKNHWFQTIDMGSTGEFIIRPTTLQPQVILLDQHGWEIMRTPLTDTETLRKYDSPMVKEYHWYPTASKVPGYHKYSFVNQAGETISQEITVYDENRKATNYRYTHNSTTLTDNPYPHIKELYLEQDDRVKSDFYVTYTVKAEYANAYAGAATFDGTSPSKYVVKQGDAYAKIASNTLTTTTETIDIENVSTDLQWYLRPNFNIDDEMGYKYSDQGGQYEEKTKAETEQEYVDAGKNGFDPYNLQIQSVFNSARYFKTNGNGMKLSNGAWEGTTSSLTLNTPESNQQEAEGNDQTTVHITNTTFMVVGADAEHMSLMPRFDNTKVVNALTGTQFTAPASATQYFSIEMVPTVVTSSDQIRGMGGYYVLAENFSMGTSSVGTSAAPFKGIIDGKLRTLTGTFNKPLVAYAEDATIRNVIIETANISSGNADGHAGAIVATAKGETRVYNCGVNGGSVGGNKYTGGIVGLLDYVQGDENKNKGSRVINCYSYATITGGTHVGGIVGYNNYASTAGDIRTMIMNCMFYGDITGGTTVSPVYGGNNINNTHGGLNTFNYYAYDKLKSKAISNNKYNCALALSEKYLTRFEFYRLLLNSNKKLAAFYITGAPSDKHLLAKWVLETADKSNSNPKPYPVLKPQGYYPSIINYDTNDLDNYSEENRNQGLKTGELTVSINLGSDAPTGASIKDGKSSITLVRTDKDFDRFNFNYDKVQLPYYNEVGEGNYTDGKVVTGWIIKGMTGGTTGTYTAADSFGGYNFADRNCTAKDIFDTSGRVFSQGAYFDVPYGVTAITIEPYWGNAAFVADEYYDVVYNSNTNYDQQKVTQVGKQVNDNTTYNGKKVYSKISDALSTLSGATVYDNAIVLVGNLHQNSIPSNGDKAFTVMSVDENNDHEPDYSMIYHHSGRTVISPIRFDFLNIPGTAQAQKPNQAANFLNFTIFLTKGWFETTNTCLVYSNQVEYENKDEKKNNVTKTNAPIILLGGDFEQFVSTQNSKVDGKTTYIHVGSNVHIQSFGLGTHGDGSQSTPHLPVSVTGGEYDGFYLSGTYNQDAAVRAGDNAECYISGGHFVEAAGASQEQIDGDIHWQIYDADIDAFYGGGINAAKPITGNITVDIYNSHVGTYCGGPKFGDMQSGKKVTTNAEGCTFTKFFGAGYGGTSYSRKKYYDKQGTDWSTWADHFTNAKDRGKYFDGKTTDAVTSTYGKKGVGVATDVFYEFFAWSTGGTGGRFYVDFASFSLATCNDVESNLTGCIIKENFYGGGSYGEVKGTATSVLDGCTVNGNVFGGGYSATLPKVKVRKTPAFEKEPNINKFSGMFEPAELADYEEVEFEWKRASDYNVKLTNNQLGSDLTNHYIYTDVDLTALGKVGATDLTVKNNCQVDGGVYGGGDESAVKQNTLVKVENVKTSGDTQNTIDNVYGGGNVADVLGDAEIHVTSGTVSHDVYGGGRGETTVVGGDVTVEIGAKEGSTLSGSGTIDGDVYGGSALGAVNATKNASTGALSYTDGKNTVVNLYGGTVSGSVFGGGLGQEAAAASGTEGEEGYVAAKSAIVAQNFGSATVNMEGGTVRTAVFGGSNVNGVVKKDATVTLTGGIVGTAPEAGSPVPDAVFGGGKGQPTLVNGDVTVNIGTLTGNTYAGSSTIHGNVYGGSALGTTNASKTGSAPMEFHTAGEGAKTTKVYLYGGTINGNVFGGGLGKQEVQAKAAVGTEGQEGYVPAVAHEDAIPAYVGGDVLVLLDGAKLAYDSSETPQTGQIFGANNLNGTPKGHVKVWVKRTVDSTKDDEVPRDSRTTYDVAAVYGGHQY